MLDDNTVLDTGKMRFFETALLVYQTLRTANYTGNQLDNAYTQKRNMLLRSKSLLMLIECADDNYENENHFLRVWSRKSVSDSFPDEPELYDRKQHIEQSFWCAPINAFVPVKAFLSKESAREYANMSTKERVIGYARTEVKVKNVKEEMNLHLSDTMKEGKFEAVENMLDTTYLEDLLLKNMVKDASNELVVVQHNTRGNINTFYRVKSLWNACPEIDLLVLPEVNSEIANAARGERLDGAKCLQKWRTDRNIVWIRKSSFCNVENLSAEYLVDPRDRRYNFPKEKEENSVIVRGCR